jgi:hypothetical protein
MNEIRKFKAPSIVTTIKKFINISLFVIIMSRKIPDTSVLAHDIVSIIKEAQIDRADTEKLVEVNFMMYSGHENPLTFTQWDPDYRMRIQLQNDHYHLAFYGAPTYVELSKNEVNEIRDILENGGVHKPVLTKGRPKTGCSCVYSGCFLITPAIPLDNAIRLYETLAELDFLKGHHSNEAP